ncbi:MAG: hypothetical protein E7046_04575 [Lentisphaerae bacterium]|nr:hypothetical protein [Lentisphaerota bacterium]
MKTKIKKIVMFLAAISVVSVLSADDAESESTFYTSMGILPVRYLELPGPDVNVKMLRLNLLAGCHKSMYGLDVGSVGNWTTGGSGGILLAGGYNVCQKKCCGLQLSCVNFTEDAHYGMQMGVVDMTWGIRGLQLGLVNVTSEGAGMQIGLYNVAEDFSGLQLGLINMNIASPMMMMPIMNVWF